MTIIKQHETEYIRAQVDMMVTLQDAHKKNPDIPLNLLGNVLEVREYANEIMRDMQALTGRPHEIRWTGIVERDESVSWVVAVEPME